MGPYRSLAPERRSGKREKAEIIMGPQKKSLNHEGGSMPEDAMGWSSREKKTGISSLSRRD